MTKKTKEKYGPYPHLDRIDLCMLSEDDWSLYQGPYTNGVINGLQTDEPEEASDAVDHPSHYHADSGIEVIDAIEAWGLGFALGNSIKYIARAGHKHNAKEDLQKALWYLTWELSKYEDK